MTTAEETWVWLVFEVALSQFDEAIPDIEDALRIEMNLSEIDASIDEMRKILASPQPPDEMSVVCSIAILFMFWNNLVDRWPMLYLKLGVALFNVCVKNRVLYTYNLSALEILELSRLASLSSSASFFFGTFISSWSKRDSPDKRMDQVNGMIKLLHAATLLREVQEKLSRIRSARPGLFGVYNGTKDPTEFRSRTVSLLNSELKGMSDTLVYLTKAIDDGPSSYKFDR